MPQPKGVLQWGSFGDQKQHLYRTDSALSECKKGYSDNRVFDVRSTRMKCLLCQRLHPNFQFGEPMTINRKLDTDENVYFYEQEFYPLSNFSSFTLSWKNIRFDTSEAAYHWEKFIGTSLVAQRSIQFAPSAHAAYQEAQRYISRRRPEWDEVKVMTMLDILREKVKQHAYVKQKLLATGDRELIEDSWCDSFWGWGENKKGLNMLGELWMQVRTEIHGAESMK